MLYITKCGTLEKSPYGTIHNFRLWASKSTQVHLVKIGFLL